MRPDEAAFETFICDWLTSQGGYDACKVGNKQGQPTDFDPVRGLDTAELFAFIGATQPKEWDKLLKLLGGDPNVAQAKFADRVSDQIDKRGTVDVLRKGVFDLGVTIRLSEPWSRPASG